MTIKQKILNKTYPFLLKMDKLLNTNRIVLINKENIKPFESFYNLTAVDIENKEVFFEEYKGKKVLIVNTASDCGYTRQYEELQKLYEIHKDYLVILAFPSNDFKEQEKENDIIIAEFCKINFGISFPLMKKSRVKKGEDQNKIYYWLTNEEKNGWNNHQPDWNFSKYLLNEEGILINFFGPAVSPLSDEVLSSIKNSIKNNEILSNKF